MQNEVDIVHIDLYVDTVTFNERKST